MPSSRLEALLNGSHEEPALSVDVGASKGAEVGDGVGDVSMSVDVAFALPVDSGGTSSFSSALCIGKVSPQDKRAASEQRSPASSGVFAGWLSISAIASQKVFLN